MTEDEIRQLLQPAVQHMGYELIDLELRLGGREGLVRLFIDRPDGVGLADCEKVSDQVGAVLDVEDPLPGQYRLEVSSPGLDRKLTRREHYQRYLGSEVKIVLRAPLDGRRRFRGRLEAMEGEAAVLRVDGAVVRLPLAEVETARLVPAL